MRLDPFTDFDALPDAAGVSARTVARLLDCNEATVWRRLKNGDLPAPIRLGTLTRWNVGGLRAFMKGEKQ